MTDPERALRVGAGLPHRPGADVSNPFFAALLETFARESKAGVDTTIVLVIDNAGWHGEAGLSVHDGVRLVFLPPHTPERMRIEDDRRQKHPARSQPGCRWSSRYNEQNSTNDR
jgi:hypothetical protein